MTESAWDDPALAPQGDMEKVKRNRWGQPLITPPGGGKAVGYQRVTTFIKAMDDGAALEKWKLRQVALGLMARPDLQAAAASLAYGCAQDDDEAKKALQQVCADALEAAASSAKATIGTALHRITEHVDRGDAIDVPEFARADVEAYRQATARFRWLHIERMMVQDDLKVAGTPDRIALVDGQPTVVDLKTGSSLWPSSHAMQLGVYANSALYDVASGERSAIGGLRTDRGLIIHVPAGSGTVRLVWVDLAAGWEAAQIAARVRDWRKRRDLELGEYAPEQVPLIVQVMRRNKLMTEAENAADLATLNSLATQAVADGLWDDDLRAVFTARKAHVAA